ncbi:hypothetical protein CVE36_01690 [Pseudomonas syringae pv. actinidiae]|nr:hypothetical protein [Pseudomonas syringae pv. actinidiae]
MSLVAINAAIRGIACCRVDSDSELAGEIVTVCDASAVCVVTLNIAPALKQSINSAESAVVLLASLVIMRLYPLRVVAVLLDRTEDGWAVK